MITLSLKKAKLLVEVLLGEKVTAGDESPSIGAILKKKRTTRRKLVP
jgi:hypothetical protein